MNMVNQKSFANMILVVVIVVLVGAVIYFTLVKNSGPVAQQVMLPSANKQTSTPKATLPTPIAHETANWKTYFNNSEKYFIKYPPTWYLDSSSPEFVTITNYDPSIDGRGGSPSVENIRIVISTYTNLAKGEQMESWVNKIGLSDKQNIVVDGIKAIRGKAHIGFNENDQSYGGDVRIVYNNKGYQIGYSPYESKLVQMFDNILSTFKFAQ